MRLTAAGTGAVCGGRSAAGGRAATRLWRTALAVCNGRVLVRGGGRIRRQNSVTGEVLWHIWGLLVWGDGGTDGQTTVGGWSYDHRLQPHAGKGPVVTRHGDAVGTTPRAVVQAADITFSMVSHTAALQAVMGGGGNIGGTAAGDGRSRHEHREPRGEPELATQVAAASAHMLDAPVSGSVITPRPGDCRSWSEESAPSMSACGRSCSTLVRKSLMWVPERPGRVHEGRHQSQSGRADAGI